MREQYAWVEWFNELSRKVSAGGRDWLVDRASQVRWRTDGDTPPLLSYGSDYVDPFSFIYTLAANCGGKPSRTRMVESVADIFELESTLPVDLAEAFYFPQQPRNSLFHGGKDHGNPELLWELFRDALRGIDAVRPEVFSGALDIPKVAVAKLTQALFLIDGEKFMPYDGSTRQLLTVDAPDTPDWHQYQQAIKELQAAFPGARVCEINLFAYLRNSGDLSGQRVYQVSTNVYDDGVDHWNDFDGNSCIYTGGLQSNIRSYPLAEPEAGDVVLTRNGGTGKALGVVWRNEYPQAMTTESRIHVIWLNKTETVTPLESFPRIGFSNASRLESTFRKREEYQPTFAVLDRVREVDGLSRDAVIRALREFDELDLPQFLERYGSPSRSHWIAFEEKEYDMKPVWRAAFSHMPGGRSREDNPKSNVVKRQLEALGFTVVVRASPPPQRQRVERTDTRIEQPLNQILYGPPGTGKTWRTVELALSIVDGNPDAERNRERFDQLAFDPAKGSGNIAMVTFHQNFAYEDFVEGIRPVLGNDAGGLRYELRDGLFKKIATEACKRDEERFVLVIDEINRGNIARIFGELITLIEPSRRLDRADATRVTLPYSTDSFGVPENLYLIGTMNTADRSIQQLDTALRRRFEFVEMMPEPDHQQMGQIEGLNLSRLLRSINDRIAALLDREHQIGHTYLLNLEDVETLGDRFRKQIFPLLQEYFFDDWSKIEAVLGRSPFVARRSVDTDLEHLDMTDEEHTLFERLPDTDPSWTSAGSYRAIYEANPSASSDA